MKPLALLFIAYPPAIDKLFETVLNTLIPKKTYKVFRAQRPRDIISRTRAEAMYRSITRLDVLAHGSPGLCKLAPGEYLFDARAGAYHLNGLEMHLAPDADVRFFGCCIAGPAAVAGKSWTFNPDKSLSWLSSKLGKRKVSAPKGDIDALDFGPDGFLTSSEPKLLSSK